MTETDDTAAPDRPHRRSPLLLWGVAPLIVAVLLAVLVVVFAPSVAPEVIVVRPGDPITTTSTSPSSTTTSTVTAEVAP